MTRKPIPDKVRKAVLDEYSHRCSICGVGRPHIHHIDGNPLNNDRLNLLPLCPNHHLADQHNPTAALPPNILNLFRRYKDPSILSPQFRPLYDRFSFLYKLTEGSSPDRAKRLADDLISFVSSLGMGGYYGDRIKELIALSKRAGTWGAEEQQRHKVKYLNQLSENTSQVEKLIVELLRYQDWSYENSHP